MDWMRQHFGPRMITVPLFSWTYARGYAVPATCVRPNFGPKGSFIPANSHATACQGTLASALWLLRSEAMHLTGHALHTCNSW